MRSETIRERTSFAVRHGEVRRTVGRHAAIEKSCDVRMVERCQNLPLREKAAQWSAGSERSAAEQLERDPRWRLRRWSIRVEMLREINDTRAALTKRTFDAVGSDLRRMRCFDREVTRLGDPSILQPSGIHRFGEPPGRLGQERLPAFVRPEQPFHVRRETRVANARSAHELGAHVRFELERGVEDRVGAPKSIRCERVRPIAL